MSSMVSPFSARRPGAGVPPPAPPERGGTAHRLPARDRRAIRVGLLIPLSGSAGIWGPSCEASARMAATEINDAGGILGRPVELVAIDAGGTPREVAGVVGPLVDEGALDAIMGTHISSIRNALTRTVRGRIPYFYTTLYEGGERSPGVFVTGETPEQQLRPAIHWLAEHRRARRWYLVGNDYVWPRLSHRSARRFIAEMRGCVVGESFLPLGCEDFEAVLADIAATAPDAVLMSLVGNDAVAFNRDFAAARLGGRMLRLSAAVEENALFGIGADNTENLYSVAGYFASLRTRENMAFLERYRGRFGEAAPMPSGNTQSCYEGLLLFQRLASQAGSVEVGPMHRLASRVSWSGARGENWLRETGVAMNIYLAQAEGLDFRVLQHF